MGVVDKYLKGTWLSKKIISICFKLADTIFLLEKVSNCLQKKISDFIHKNLNIPFSIDIAHWVYKPKKHPRLKELLFIGNIKIEILNFSTL